MNRPLEEDIMSMSGNRSLSPEEMYGAGTTSAMSESGIMGKQASSPQLSGDPSPDMQMMHQLTLTGNNSATSDSETDGDSQGKATSQTQASSHVTVELEQLTAGQQSITPKLMQLLIFTIVYTFAFILLTTAITAAADYFIRPFEVFTLPPFNAPAIIFVSYQIFIIIVIYWWQRYEPSPYNKFWTIDVSNSDSVAGKLYSHTIPTRWGMCYIYFIPSISGLILFVIQLMMPSMSKSAINTIPSLLVSLKFAKRVLECAFLHRFSGRMPTALALSFPILYALFSVVPCIYVGKSEPLHGTVASRVRFALGIVIFCVGEVGNGWYHLRLRQLRKVRKNESAPKTTKRSSIVNQIEIVTKGNRRYIVPKGELFNYVVAPHYLFEIISFVGIAVATFHLCWILSLLIFISNLCGRGRAALKWYRKKFGNQWPRNRRALIPFIY